MIKQSNKKENIETDVPEEVIQVLYEMRKDFIPETKLKIEDIMF